MIPDYIRKTYEIFDNMYNNGMLTDYTYMLLTSSLDNYY